MKAAFYSRRGPAKDVLQVGEQPEPQPQAGEVRVRVHTSGVNPSDWKSRSGATTAAPVPGYIIPHSDGAGVIDAVGPGVDRGRIGERVWLWNGQWQRPHGTAAEFIALPARQAVPLPAAIDFAAGACLGIPAMTALQAVRRSGVKSGDTVLVHGGAGSVAHYAIQFARQRGARVLTTISSAAKAAHAERAGAHATIDYRRENVGERVQALTHGKGVDAVIDVDYSANARLLPGVIRPHGRVVVYGTNQAECTIPVAWIMRSSVDVLSFLVYDLHDEDRNAVLAEIDAALRAGTLQHTVAKHFPLDAIVAAHELVEQGGAIGNVVLDVA